MVVDNCVEFLGEQYQSRVLESLTELSKYQPSLKHLDQNADGGFASSNMRDVAVDRLKCLNKFFRLDPQTFALAVNFFDRFLTIIKVRPKYLDCVSITCYYMAIQQHEPEHNLIDCVDLLRISQSPFTVSDVARMSKLISDKLRTDTMAVTVTPLTFLQLYHDLCRTLGLISPDDRDVAITMETLVAELEACLCQTNLADFPYHVLSLCVLLVATESSGHTYTASEVATIIQYLCQISDEELETCKQVVSEFLEDYQSPVSKHPTSKLQWYISRRTSKAVMESVLFTQRMPTITEEVQQNMIDRYETDDSAVTPLSVDMTSDLTSPSECHIPVSLTPVGQTQTPGDVPMPTTSSPPDNGRLDDGTVPSDKMNEISSGSPMQRDTMDVDRDSGAVHHRRTTPDTPGICLSLPQTIYNGYTTTTTTTTTTNTEIRQTSPVHPKPPDSQHFSQPPPPPSPQLESPPSDHTVTSSTPPVTPSPAEVTRKPSVADSCPLPVTPSPAEVTRKPSVADSCPLPVTPSPDEVTRKPSVADSCPLPVTPSPAEVTRKPSVADSCPLPPPAPQSSYCTIVDFFRGGIQSSRYPICKLELCQSNIPNVKVSFPTMIA